jgi:predicted acetyltransferase
MVLHLRSAGSNDVRLLAEMNKQLIEDEGSANPMNLEQLEARMHGWLSEDWRADLIVNDEENVVGYSLYQFRSTPHFPDRNDVYLRQYFIRRDCRNRGYGLEGISMLRETRFGDVETIEIDVLETNRIGKGFWSKAGFEPYVINMRLKNRIREAKVR